MHVYHTTFSIFFCSFFIVEGVEHGLEFSIMKAFNWIGPRMDFIPSIDGFSEVIPRVLPCFSNVSFNIFHNMYVQ